LELHEIGQNVEAYNLTIKALSVLESYDLDETPLYSECLHDAGMFALLAFNDISLFSTYMEKAINLKYDLYGFSNDYYWSKECFANGLVYLANRIVFPQNIDLWESAIKLYEEIPNHILMNGYTQALNNLAVNYEYVNVNKSIELCEKLISIKREKKDADSLIVLSNLFNSLGFFFFTERKKRFIIFIFFV
jgi:tetratricopeptide (TPR) repeat protein